eukprot:239311-Rhodomonas_salina.1
MQLSAHSRCDPPGNTFVILRPRPTASRSCPSSRKPESCRLERTKPRSLDACDPPGKTFVILTPRPTAS